MGKCIVYTNPSVGSSISRRPAPIFCWYSSRVPAMGVACKPQEALAIRAVGRANYISLEAPADARENDDNSDQTGELCRRVNSTSVSNGIGPTGWRNSQPPRSL